MTGASRAVLAVTAAAVVAAAIGVGVDALRGSGRPAAAGGSPPPASTKVTRQTLVDTRSENGKLSHGDAATVTGRLAGTVTALPATGSTIRRGQALYRVDNGPVVLLYGALPAYRALSRGAKGTDVEQFERNLAALGYQGFTVDRTYSAATVTAVKAWQRDLGLPGTGRLELGRVVYAARPVRVDSRKAAVGDAVRPGQPMLTYTGGVRVATADLDLADQAVARKGVPVRVELPDGKPVPGRVTRSRTVVSTGDKPKTRLRVTIAIADQAALAAYDQAAVTIDFTASRRKNVLTVPVAALLALAGGGYGVQAVDGTVTRIVAVETGMFADGRVEVSGSGLREGMTVGMPA